MAVVDVTVALTILCAGEGCYFETTPASRGRVIIENAGHTCTGRGRDGADGKWYHNWAIPSEKDRVVVELGGRRLPTDVRIEVAADGSMWLDDLDRQGDGKTWTYLWSFTELCTPDPRNAGV